MPEQSPAWQTITATEPPDDVPVLTRIDDGRGERNETTLVRMGRLWFFPDMSMYVYYTPTHFIPSPSDRKAAKA